MSKVRSPLSCQHAWLMLRRITAATVTAVLVVFAFGPGAPAFATTAARNGTSAGYEVTFMKRMILHHHMAIMMSEVCAERAGELRPELVEVCEQIIETQHDEVAMMQAWLEQWYGVTGFNPHHEMGSEMMEMVGAMRAMSPADFERFFLEEMIVHHSGALQPARQCQGRARHTELEDLCRDIVEMQVAEIEQMRAWLCEWFGECNYHVDPHRRRAMHG